MDMRVTRVARPRQPPLLAICPFRDVGLILTPRLERLAVVPQPLVRPSLVGILSSRIAFGTQSIRVACRLGHVLDALARGTASLRGYNGVRTNRVRLGGGLSFYLTMGAVSPKAMLRIVRE